MTRQEFDKMVDAKKKRILMGDAEELFYALKSQYLHRYGSLYGNSVDVILTEIAQARIVGCDLIKGSLIKQYLEDN